MAFKMKKIVLISEFLDAPYDEGIKKTVYQLYQLLDQHYYLLVICRKGPDDTHNIRAVTTNRFFVSPKIKADIKSFSPDLIIYFPFASSTFAGFLRNFIFARYHSQAANLMIVLQPKPVKGWQRQMIKFIRPQKVLTPSPLLKNRLDALNINTSLFPLSTDLPFFKPLDQAGQKEILRAKYNIDVDSFVITHVGHLNHGRNLTSLIPLQNNKTQVIIVGSSSTPEDAAGPANLKAELEEHGIIIHDGFIERINEIYQLSDLYIFPVEDQNSSIGMPLSILEARACGIPVLSTDYGSVKIFLGDDFCGIFYCKPDDFAEMVEEIKESDIKDYTRTSVSKLNDQFNVIIKQSINEIV